VCRCRLRKRISGCQCSLITMFEASWPELWLGPRRFGSPSALRNVSDGKVVSDSQLQIYLFEETPEVVSFFFLGEGETIYYWAGEIAQRLAWTVWHVHNLPILVIICQFGFSLGNSLDSPHDVFLDPRSRRIYFCSIKSTNTDARVLCHFFFCVSLLSEGNSLRSSQQGRARLLWPLVLYHFVS
jgi:hypothetical protein